MSCTKQCTYELLGPKSSGGRGLRTWRRKCKRKSEVGTDRCWQHRRPT